MNTRLQRGAATPARRWPQNTRWQARDLGRHVNIDGAIRQQRREMIERDRIAEELLLNTEPMLEEERRYSGIRAARINAHIWQRDTSRFLRAQLGEQRFEALIRGECKVDICMMADSDFIDPEMERLEQQFQAERAKRFEKLSDPPPPSLNECVAAVKRVH